jgi:riboflavin kinase / FMN adenylyltransferase
MQVHHGIENLPGFRNAVVTIGTFDGVHLGHRQIINRLKEEAAEVNGESVIITFHPHPRKVVSSTILGIRLINTMEEKIRLLSDLHVNHLVVVPFTDAFANQPAEDYVKNFLVDKFHPHTVIIGFDHRFGKDRLGDYKLLEKMAPELDYRLREIPRHIQDEIAISSTNIREAILHRDFETANKLLGYEFFFEGEIVHGDKMGRQLGYPTANLKISNEEKIIPGDGIYAVYAEMGNGQWAKGNILRYKGMMSIGFRPTMDGTHRVIEVNIFDFDEEIYGQTLRVYVKKYLRAEVKFKSIDELKTQIGEDKLESLRVL